MVITYFIFKVIPRGTEIETAAETKLCLVIFVSAPYIRDAANNPYLHNKYSRTIKL